MGLSHARISIKTTGKSKVYRAPLGMEWGRGSNTRRPGWEIERGLKIKNWAFTVFDFGRSQAIVLKGRFQHSDDLPLPLVALLFKTVEHDWVLSLCGAFVKNWFKSLWYGTPVSAALARRISRPGQGNAG